MSRFISWMIIATITRGIMVPPPANLKWFDLVTRRGTVSILQYPLRRSPTSVEPLPDYPKLLAAFRQYGQWLTRLGIGSGRGIE